MAKAAYPTEAEFALFLADADVLNETIVTGNDSSGSTSQTVEDNSEIKVGDSLLFVTANVIRTVTVKTSTTGVTVDTSVDTVVNERVVIIPKGFDLAATVTAGILAFEREVGRKMLATSDTARLFDPTDQQRGVVDLRDDLASLAGVYIGGGEVEVTTGAASTVQTLSATGSLEAGDKLLFMSAGVVREIASVDSATQITLTSSVTSVDDERVLLLTTYVRGTHFRLLPLDATARGMPYFAAQFKTPHIRPISWSAYSSLVIEGRWGYGTTLPENVWRAMLAFAGIELMPMLGWALSHGVISWTEADVTENYGNKPLEGIRSLWQMQTDQVVQQYRRVTVGIATGW